MLLEESDDEKRYKIAKTAITVTVSISDNKSMQIINANNMAILNYYGASCQMIDSSGGYLMYDDAKLHEIKLVSNKRTNNKNGIIEIIADETSGVYYVKTTQELYEDTGYTSLYPLR